MSEAWSQAFDIIGAAFILAGSLFTFIAALGLVRLPDLLSRMHAAAKPQMLGLALLLGGLTITLRSWQWVALAAAVLAIQMVAAPVASHMLGRAAYRRGLANTPNLVVDQLADDTEAG